MQTKLLDFELFEKRIRTVAYSFLLLGFIVLLMSSCKKDDTGNPVVTDIDGNVYHTVNIGEQVWLVENLNVTRYRNGDSIPNITDNIEWTVQTSGAYCNYDNSGTNGKYFGKLYNWAAVADSRNIAPEGWHIPSDEEWLQLENHVAANLGTSPNIAKALAAKTEWAFYSEDGAIGKDLTKNNSSGFTALPGGYRLNGKFTKIGEYGGWWSSTELEPNNAWIRVLFFSYSNPATIYDDQLNGFSVRCVQD